MKKVFLIVFVILLVGATVFWRYFGNFGRNDFSDQNTGIIPTSMSSAVESDIPPVLDGWKMFESEAFGFSLRYPPEMEVAENEDGSVRFLLIGPSQTRGTEVYDGIILTFFLGNYSDDSLLEYVDQLVSEKRNDPIYIEVGDVEEVDIGGISGYRFTESALGEFTNIYLPWGDEGGYLNIFYLLEDPKNQGFEEILDKMLSSFSKENVLNFREIGGD